MLRSKPFVLRLHFHAGFVIDGFAGLDCHEDVLIIGIFLIYIMGIVGESKGNARLLVEADQAGGGPLLFRDFRLRSQGPCRLGTGESGLVLG